MEDNKDSYCYPTSITQGATMICPYCQKPILKGQETRLRIDKETEEEKLYHKGCFEMYLNELIDKVRGNKGDRS